MTDRSEREILIKALFDTYFEGTHSKTEYPNFGPQENAFGRVADFILADRKRIVKPLIEWKEATDITTIYEGAGVAIDQTIKNAQL